MQARPYCLQTGYIDYDKLEEKALDFRPKLIISGGSAYPREWDYKRLREIANRVGALLMTDMAHIRCRISHPPATHLDCASRSLTCTTSVATVCRIGGCSSTLLHQKQKPACHAFSICGCTSNFYDACGLHKHADTRSQGGLA